MKPTKRAIALLAHTFYGESINGGDTIYARVTTNSGTKKQWSQLEAAGYVIAVPKPRIYKFSWLLAAAGRKLLEGGAK